MSDRIEKIIVVNAPIEKVWRALTNHVEFGEWFKVKLEGPFVVGQITRGQMTYPGYEHYPWESRVEVMDEPRLFAYTWPHAKPDEDTAKAAWTRVEFRLERVAGGTRLKVVESGFDAVPEDRRAEAMRGNEKGWEEQAGNIKAYVER